MAQKDHDPRTYFEQKQQEFAAHLSATERKIRQISRLRIIIFLSTVVAIYLLASVNLFALVTTGAVGFGVFIFLVARHAALFKKKQWYSTLVAIYTTELALLDGNLSVVPGGEEYMDDHHPFTSDLDIFGQRSLFQLIDRSATTRGRQQLAGRFSAPLKEAGELVKRQEAIRELANKPQWRQHFQALGKLAGDEEFAVDDFISWAGNSQIVFNRLFYRIMLVITPLLGFGVVFLIAAGILGFGAFIIYLLLPLFMTGMNFSAVNKIHHQVSRRSNTLEKYSRMFGLLADESFTSAILRESRKNMADEEIQVREMIGKLSRITTAFDYRLNFLVGFFLNIFFLWDIRQCVRLEGWKRKYGSHMEKAFNTLFLFDELSSLAGFSFSHPDAGFPVFAGEEFMLEAKNVRHPLISAEKSVGNPVSIHGWGKFQIITGANMAGKSTYLRTIGVNMVLAMTGAPVLAGKFNMSLVDIHTGIKTSDSLQDGESYFFAELKRLKEIITRLENGEKLFVLLDEILRGTNSVDKHKGSEGLLKQLIRLGCSGMIATHDVALGRLQETFPDNIINKCFEVDIHDDELIFDYRIRDGVSQNTNASILMKKMGITL